MCHRVSAQCATNQVRNNLWWNHAELPESKQYILDKRGVALRTDVSRHEVDTAPGAVVEEPVEPLLGCGREATASAAAATEHVRELQSSTNRPR